MVLAASEVIGGLYRSLGQEGESVASAYALQDGNVLSPLIRNLGSMLVRGGKQPEVLRQYMAKAAESSTTRPRDERPFRQFVERLLGQYRHLGDVVRVMSRASRCRWRSPKERRVRLVLFR